MPHKTIAVDQDEEEECESPQLLGHTNFENEMSADINNPIGEHLQLSGNLHRNTCMGNDSLEDFLQSQQNSLKPFYTQLKTEEAQKST